MIHLTAAVADFMMILMRAALWVAAEVAGVALIVLAASGLAVAGARSLWHRWRS